MVVVEAIQANPQPASAESLDAHPLVYHNRNWHHLGVHSLIV